MVGDDLTDDYVAKLLAKDARESSLKYSDLGMGAFIPSKPPATKPKPNTRFLRNIIKETDSHNAALLAKEAADAQARLQSLSAKDPKSGADIRRRQLGFISTHLNGRSNVSHINISSSSRGQNRDHLSKREARGRPEADQGSGDERRRRNRRGRDEQKDTRQHRRPNEQDRRHKKKSTRSRSASPTEGPYGRSRRRGDYSPRRGHYRSRSRDKERRHDRSRQDHGTGSSRSSQHKSTPDMRSSKVDDEDSDPLDDIIGPRPPVIQIISKGRGTKSAASGIDTRFSRDYDPTADVALDPEEDDDWDQALEALRDRQKWKQQGADRLRAAGFTDEEISKWEKGGEKGEEDVRWVKKGEGREWDRGKLVEAEASVKSDSVDMWDIIVRKRSPDIDLTFGRLKGT